MMGPRVRRPVEADRAAWERLFASYAEFYKVPQPPGVRERVWGWIHDPEHEVEAFVVEDDAGVVGFAHFRPYARPLFGTVGGFLDDLFVAPEARGSGAAEALIRAIAQEGRERGWSVIRWITDEGNARARKLYDRVARPTRWVTYDLMP